MSEQVAQAPAQSDQKIVLPETYFRDHFWMVIDDVATRYHSLLTFDEHRYLKTVRALSLDALTLYVRLINRRGPVFQIAKLTYLDPTALANAVAELQTCHFLQAVDETILDDDVLVSSLTLAEMRHCLAAWPVPKINKADICAWLLAHPDWIQMRTHVFDRFPMIQLCETPWPFFKFLYFGQLVPNLSDFVVQDLGHIVTETIAVSALTPRFTTRRQADDAYRMQCIYDDFRTVRDGEIDDLLSWWQAQGLQRSDLDPMAHDGYDRLIARLGRLLERSKNCDEAIAVYRHSLVAPSRERCVRLLLKAGESDEAMALCAQGLHAPSDPDEAYALQQIWNRHHKIAKTNQATRFLKEAERIDLDWSHTSVEQAVLDHLAAQGWHGVHSENWLWCNLFGLLLWDVIFDASKGGFSHALQIAPHHLFKPRFFANRTDDVNTILAMLSCPETTIAHLTACHERKQGIANPLVSWHPDTLAMVARCVRSVPSTVLQAVMWQMTQHVGAYSRGFPDLFVWRDDDYCFIEVKSVTDHLSAQQYEWLTLFQSWGLKAKILRVYPLAA